MEKYTNLERYILQYADNNLILGHRLSEWCGHGPVLEQDIALTNIALDLIGLARNYYQYAAEITNRSSEDFYPYQRLEREFFNVLLVELPNVDFAYTIIRQFLYDVFHYHFLQKLSHSKDSRLQAISLKSIKEVTYHVEFSTDWVLRLGDGTEESHQKIQNALNDYFPFSSELFNPSQTDNLMAASQIGVILKDIQPVVQDKWKKVFQEATLSIPSMDHFQKNGKRGIHTEHMGKILAEMQYLQRVYPDATW